MARTIKVTPELLETAAGQIETLAGEYQQQYNLLYTETGSMAASWSGKDNVAFTTRIEGYRDDFQNMYKRMMDYATFLRNSAKSYRTTQDTVVREAGNLTN